MDTSKLEKAVKNLEEASSENMDTADILGVVVDDFADLYRSKNKAQFVKQKKDLRKTLKVFKRKIENMTYRDL